jgi:tryptophan synthase alpha chain
MGFSGGTRRSMGEVFGELRAKKRIALMPFIPAGFPDLETTGALLPALEEGGASLIEVGIPFSDPIADGPTIQEAFTAALARKLKLRDVFAAVAAARSKVSIPLVAMVSYSVAYRTGVDGFLRRAKEAGFDGLILPDLPPPEANEVCRAVRQAGLETILLVAPSTTAQRRKEIAELSSGFVYYLSVAGVTGERSKLPEDLARNVKELKQLTDRPVSVGFGISSARQVAQLSEVADGAIVGSALVRRIREHAGEGAEAIAAAGRKYCGELLGK